MIKKINKPFVLKAAEIIYFNICKIKKKMFLLIIKKLYKNLLALMNMKNFPQVIFMMNGLS